MPQPFLALSFLVTPKKPPTGAKRSPKQPDLRLAEGTPNSINTLFANTEVGKLYFVGNQELHARLEKN